LQISRYNDHICNYGLSEYVMMLVCSVYTHLMYIRNYLCVFWAGYFLCSLNFNQNIDRNGNKRVHRQHIFTDAIINIQTGEWIVVRRYTQCCCPVMHPPTTSSGLPCEQWKHWLDKLVIDIGKSEVTTITELYTMDILATISFFKIDTADW